MCFMQELYKGLKQALSSWHADIKKVGMLAVASGLAASGSISRYKDEEIVYSVI